MNQPASKEPTMDEILSSIRQIIADDDEAATQKMPAAPKAVVAKAAPAPIAMAEPMPVADHVIDPFSDDDDEGVAPLALSPAQIIEEEVAAEAAMDKATSLLQTAAELVMPDDVAFEQDEDVVPEEAEEDAGSQMAAMLAEVEPERPVVESAPSSFAQAAPMPDPDLASDLTAELLEPATSAAVRNAFSRLNTPRVTPEMALGASGLTIEAMIREMLRPMLKEWLEENLPSMVERIVASEIERVSRGGN